MQYENILLQQEGSTAIITFNRPASRNGLTGELQREVLHALDRVSRQAEARALILTGAGQAFCSGADLGRLDTEGGSCGQTVASMMDELSNPLILALQALPMPVVAAVNGAAAGAGVGIALAADIVIAARSAFFLSNFLPRLGIVPDMGTTWFLPQRVGRARSTGLMLLGDRLPAGQAAEWGLIWSCVEDEALMDEARRTATRLGNAPAHAVVEARRALDKAGSQNLAEQLDYEMHRQRELLDLPSFREGVQAFFEKREPVFRRT